MVIAIIFAKLFRLADSSEKIILYIGLKNGNIKNMMSSAYFDS
jgi:hypothetical protein